MSMPSTPIWTKFYTDVLETIRYDQRELRRTYSIIIPTGYRQRYLTLAIADLVAQDFPSDRFEIVVVDDTPDGANRELIEGLANVPVRYLRREGPPGINAGRNTGTKHSTGDILA